MKGKLQGLQQLLLELPRSCYEQKDTGKSQQQGHVHAA